MALPRDAGHEDLRGRGLDHPGVSAIVTSGVTGWRVWQGGEATRGVGDIRT